MHNVMGTKATLSQCNEGKIAVPRASRACDLYDAVSELRTVLAHLEELKSSIGVGPAECKMGDVGQESPVTVVSVLDQMPGEIRQFISMAHDQINEIMGRLD